MEISYGAWVKKGYIRLVYQVYAWYYFPKSSTFFFKDKGRILISIKIYSMNVNKNYK